MFLFMMIHNHHIQQGEIPGYICYNAISLIILLNISTNAYIYIYIFIYIHITPYQPWNWKDVYFANWLAPSNIIPWGLAAEEQIMRNALIPLKAIAERLEFSLTQARYVDDVDDVAALAGDVLFDIF